MVRGGFGVVFGSKKFKGIFVKGSKKVLIVDLEKFCELIKKWVFIFKDYFVIKVDMEYGSGEFFDWMNCERGIFLVRNW